MEKNWGDTPSATLILLHVVLLLLKLFPPVLGVTWVLN